MLYRAALDRATTVGSRFRVRSLSQTVASWGDGSMQQDWIFAGANARWVR